MRRECQPAQRFRSPRAAGRLSQATRKELSKSAGTAGHWQIQVQAPAARAAECRLQPPAASLFERDLYPFAISQTRDAVCRSQDNQIAAPLALIQLLE